MGDVILGLAVDASGSMMSQRNDLIEGINNLLDAQRDLGGECRVSTVLFDTQLDVRNVCEPIANIDVFGSAKNPYSPGGGTALYDAVGSLIEGVDAWIAAHEFSGSVVIAIWTDGMENSSVSYSLDRVKQLIDQKGEEGWAFQFLGSGESSWVTTKAFDGLKGVHIRNFDNNSISNSESYAALNTALTTSRLTGSAYKGA